MSSSVKSEDSRARHSDCLRRAEHVGTHCTVFDGKLWLKSTKDGFKRGLKRGENRVNGEEVV